MIFADTRIFIDFLSGSEEEVNRIEELLREFERKKRKLYISQEVVVELVYYLLDTVDWDRSLIREVVGTIVNDSLFKVENKEIVSEALEIFESKGLDFLDALKLAKMKKKKISQALSYNERLSDNGIRLIRP